MNKFFRQRQSGFITSMEEVKNLSGLECYLNKPIKRLYNIMAPGTFFKSAGWQDYVKNKVSQKGYNIRPKQRGL